MPLIAHFAPKSMSAATCAEILKRLEAAGAAKPPGRLHHTCYGRPDALLVVDVFDTMASFEAFGKTLGPILAAIGLDVGHPDVAEVHNIMVGG